MRFMIRKPVFDTIKANQINKKRNIGIKQGENVPPILYVFVIFE